MRRFWENTLLEAVGWAELGAAAAVALLLYPPARRRLGAWASRAARRWRKVMKEVSRSPGVRIGIPLATGVAMAATAGAATVASEGAGAAAAPAAAAMPVAIQGIHTAVEVKDLLDDMFDDDGEQREGHDADSDPEPDPPDSPDEKA